MAGRLFNYTFMKQKIINTPSIVVPTGVEELSNVPASTDSNSSPEAIANSPRMRDLNLGTRLGAGGMGIVYKAHHKAVDKTLAVKMLHHRFADDAQVRKRFENEAHSASLLTHVNLASVYDFGVSDRGEPYLVMDYIDGTTLQDVLKNETSLSVPRFLHIFKQVCEALSHAHMKQIVHRDLKPANIMLVASADQADFVKVLDFGIAKAMPQPNTDEQRLTQTGEVLGSPIYMSPEQCLGDTADARSDIYALGCVMYESLVGRPPFLRDNVVQTILAHLNDKPVPLNEAVPERAIPEALETIVLKCLEKNPLKRFQTIEEVKDALELADESLSAHERRLVAARLFKSKLKRALRNNRRTTALVLTAMFAVGTLCTLFAMRAHDETVLKETIKAADTLDYRQEPQRAQPYWQKAIALAERLAKPDRAVANLYRKLADDCTFQQASLKESSLKKTVQLLEKAGASKVEYISALRSLTAYLETSRKGFVQPLTALQALQVKAEVAEKAGNYTQAEQYFEEQLKLDRDAWHPHLGLARCAAARAANAPIEEQLRLAHRAAFLYPRIYVRYLNSLIPKLGKNPFSFDDRIALATAAARKGDLEGAAIEYQTALEIKADPAIRRTLQELYEQIRQHNEAIDKHYYNTTVDEQTSVLEKLLIAEKAVESQHEDAVGADQRFSNMQPLILPKVRKAHQFPVERGTTGAMASLATCYAEKFRFAECEFMLKEYLQHEPSLISMNIYDWNMPPKKPQHGFPLLANIVHLRNKNEEAAHYFKFLVKHCLGNPLATSNDVDQLLIGEYADVLHELNRKDEELKARELITTRKKTRDETKSHQPDMFSSGGGSGYKEPDIELDKLTEG